MCVDGCEPNGWKCKKSCDEPKECPKGADGAWRCDLVRRKDADDSIPDADDSIPRASDDDDSIRDADDDDDERVLGIRGRGKWACSKGELCCPPKRRH